MSGNFSSDSRGRITSTSAGFMVSNPAAMREARFKNYSGEVAYTGTQGASSDGTFAWITAGSQQRIWKIDLSTWDIVDSNTDFFPDGQNDHYLQTSHFSNGGVYGFTRSNSIHRIDPDTLEHLERWDDVVPDAEIVNDHWIWEGITRYNGAAFSESKWFVCDRSDSQNGDRAVYRLKGPADNFEYEDRYVLNDTNPELEGRTDGYDGIEILDHDGEALLFGSNTTAQNSHPSVDVFTFDVNADQWEFVGEKRVITDKFKTPDEGFQIISMDEVYCGLRHPFGGGDTAKQLALSKQDWSGIY